MLVERDLDKYAIQRILDFNDRQPPDLADHFEAAWRYTNRFGVSLAWKEELQFPQRFSVVFLGCGLNEKHCGSEGSGEQMGLSHSLEPLKGRINLIHGLFNRNNISLGIHPPQRSWLNECESVMNAPTRRPGSGTVRPARSGRPINSPRICANTPE